MKLTDLLFNREKLRKFDELREWREKIEANMVFIPQSCNQVLGEYTITRAPLPLPKNIQEIILSALDAEIKKLDEE